LKSVNALKPVYIQSKNKDDAANELMDALMERTKAQMTIFLQS